MERIFDEKGNFQDREFDPYRSGREHPTWRLLFDENGYLSREVSMRLPAFIKDKKLPPFSDAVALYHADHFALNTKGNYSTGFYWR